MKPEFARSKARLFMRDKIQHLRNIAKAANITLD